MYCIVLTGIVRESGSICKCFHEDYEDIPVDDELRKVIPLYLSWLLEPSVI